MHRLQVAFARRGAVAVLASVAALGVAAPPAAADPFVAPDCAQPFPLSQVARGLVGTGVTTRAGRTPETFTATVLGVVPNIRGAGRHAIVADLAGPLLDAAGGVWSGMSGSPVFVDGKLLGVVSIGFTTGPTRVAGLTPAEELYGLLPAGARGTAAALGDALAEGAEPLPLPVGISGLAPSRLGAVRRILRTYDLPFRLSLGAGHAPNAPATGTTVHAGEPIAAALATGDLSIAATGTTSAVCGGRVLGFGHAFVGLGDVSLPAFAADAVTVLAEPTASPFVLATLGQRVGTIVRDSAAGIEGPLGASPDGFPVTSTVSVPSRGASRYGETQVWTQEFAWLLGPLAVLANMDSTWDAQRGGSAVVTWTIDGKAPDGKPFRYSRTNAYSSPVNIGQDMVGELSGDLTALGSSGFGPVELRGVNVVVTVDPAPSAYRIDEVLIRVPGGKFEPGFDAVVSPGDEVDLRVRLVATDTGARRNVDFSFPAPKGSFSLAEVFGGASRPESVLTTGPGVLTLLGPCPGAAQPACGLLGEGRDLKTFGRLLKRLRNAPRNDTLVLRVRGSEGGLKELVIEQLDRVVRGARFIPVSPPGDESEGSFEEE